MKALTLLEPQSRFGDKPLKFQVVCPQNETAVLKGLSPLWKQQEVFKSFCFARQKTGIISPMNECREQRLLELDTLCFMLTTINSRRG